MLLTALGMIAATLLSVGLSTRGHAPVASPSSSHRALRSCTIAAAASDDPLLGWLAEQGGHARVASGTDADGLRGLVVTEAVEVGAVLLEVPLTATLLDRGDGSATGPPLPGEPPAWSASRQRKARDVT